MMNDPALELLRTLVAELRLRIARAQLLRQIARDGVAVADLLRFARIVGAAPSDSTWRRIA